MVGYIIFINIVLDKRVITKVVGICLLYDTRKSMFNNNKKMEIKSDFFVKNSKR